MTILALWRRAGRNYQRSRRRNTGSENIQPEIGNYWRVSIIGTSGIVKPFSSEAFVDAIRKEVEVAYAINAESIGYQFRSQK